MTKIASLSCICILILLAGCGNQRYGYLMRSKGSVEKRAVTREKREVKKGDHFALHAMRTEDRFPSRCSGQAELRSQEKVDSLARGNCFPSRYSGRSQGVERKEIEKENIQEISLQVKQDKKTEVAEDDPPQPIRIKNRKAKNAMRYLGIAALLFVLSIGIFAFVVESWFIILSDLLYSMLFTLVAAQALGSFAFFGFSFILGLRAMKQIREADATKIHYTNKVSAVIAILVGGFITAFILASLASAVDGFLAALVFVAVMIFALKALF